MDKISAVFSVPPRKGTKGVSVRHNGKVLYYNVSQKDVAVDGGVIFVRERDDFFGGPESKAFRSKKLMNPTWRKVFAEFKKSIAATKDLHHIYLEGAYPTGEMDGGVPIYRFSAGS